MALAAGSRLGSYEILGLLGAGGMGEVYEARDARLERLVALKLLPAEMSADPERLARLEREAKAVAALNHPNIVTLHSIEEIQGIRFLVLERITGRSLSEVKEPHGLSIGRILELAIPIGEALAAAHERGVVHRDLKPANVMVTDEGRVKVLDFGLAKVQVSSPVPVVTEAATEGLTRDGQVFGTVPYMAPEQLRGEHTDNRVDIFSFGAILYELASGQRPFVGVSAADVVSAILKEDPPSLEAIRPDLPVAFVRIVKHCLEKDRRHRKQSAVDLCRELRDVDEELRKGSGRAFAGAGLDAVAPVLAPARVPRTGPWLALAAGAVLLAVAASVLILHFWSSAQPASGAASIRSLAVLPFDNLTHDTSQDYFVDGMHDALITDLVKLGVLKVTSRGSVQRFKDGRKPLKVVAQELGVDAIIEGSVLRTGNRVRITAQLIRGSTDEHIWAESYDRDLEDVLQLLRDVSRSIVEEVRLKVAGGTGPALPPEPVAAPKVRLEAWEAYLKGRQAITESFTLSAADISKALGEFRRSVDLDPGFARGWSGVAMANILLGVLKQAPVADVLPVAREAAKKALSLDDRLGEARGVLGMIALYYDWDFDVARRQLEQALELSPHDLLVRHAWADYLMVSGRFEESLEQVILGQSYEPMSPAAEGLLLFHTMATHRFDDVIAEARRSTAVFPNLLAAHTFLGDAYWRMGRYEDALAEYRLRYGPQGDRPRVLEAGLRRSGPRAALKAWADHLAARMQAGRGSPLDVASAYGDAGESDLALSWLERAYVERTPMLLHIVADPGFDGIREDPRYNDLLRRIGIPMARPAP